MERQAVATIGADVGYRGKLAVLTIVYIPM
jgi:hypothetical protein